MKFFQSVFVLLLLVALTSGCKKDDASTNSSGSTYTNKINIGTGVDYAKFLIVGETSTFTRIGSYATIYWRLESANDMGGSDVNIKIEKLTGTNYVTDTLATFPSTQNYGHIMISNISLQHTGSFKMTGILVNGNVAVASTNFTVQ
jgi:hypothetical protein